MHSGWPLKYWISFAIHLWVTLMRFMPKNFVIIAGIHELKSYFCAMLSHCFLYIKQLFTLQSVACSGYFTCKTFKQQGKHPPPATFIEVNNIPLTPKIWLLILLFSCYTFSNKLISRICCFIMKTTSTWSTWVFSLLFCLIMYGY